MQLPKITLITYQVEMSHPSSVATAVIDVGNKFQTCVKICRSKKDGQLFGCFPAQKINERWYPCNLFAEKELNTHILTESLRLLTPYLNSTELPLTTPKNDYPDFEGLPF